MRLSTMPIGLCIPQAEEPIPYRTSQLVPIAHNSYGLNTLYWKVILNLQHIIRDEMEDKCAEVFLPWPDAVTDIFDCEKAYPTETEIAMRFMENIMSTHQTMPQRIFRFKDDLNEIASGFSSIPSNVSQIFEAYSFSDSEENLLLQNEIMKAALLRVLSKTELSIVVIPEPGEIPRESIMCLDPYGTEPILYNNNLDAGFRPSAFAEEKPEVVLKRHNISAKKKSFRPTFATKIGELYAPGKVSIRSSFMKEETVFTDSPYFMGHYKLDLTRIIDCIISLKHDEHGMFWPKGIAPFEYHIVAIPEKSSEAERIYSTLTQEGIKVIIDDRDVDYKEKITFAWKVGSPRIIIIDNTWDKNGKSFKVTDRTDRGLYSLSVEEIIETHNRH